MSSSVDRRIRLARVIARTNVGGPSLQTTALMRGIDQETFDQVLFRGTVDDGEADYLELRAADVPSTLVPGLGRSVNLLDDVRALWFLIRQFREFRPVVVHTHTAKAGILGRLAALLTGVPIRIHTFHGHVLHGYFSPTTTRVVVLLERVFGALTTHIVAVGDQVRDDLVHAHIAQPGRCSVVAPGVRKSEPMDRGEARRRLALPDDDRLTVVFVGRLTRIKRTERFVDLARQLLDEGIEARFMVVGDGPERAELESRASGVDGIVFVGWQSDMAAVYGASDLIVLTSDNEGMPVALIEAAMQGIPAVTTDVGAVRQVVVDHVSGYVVPVDDQRARVEAVKSLCSDARLRSTMGMAASRHAMENFGEARLVGDYEFLYKDLVSKLSPRRRRRRA